MQYCFLLLLLNSSPMAKRLTTEIFERLDTSAVDEIIDNEINAAIDQIYIFNHRHDTVRIFSVRGINRLTACINLLRNKEFIKQLTLLIPESSDDTLWFRNFPDGVIKMTRAEWDNWFKEHLAALDTCDTVYINKMYNKMTRDYHIEKLSDTLIQQ